MKLERRRVNDCEVVEKPWGKEIILVNNEEANYCGKILEINPGKNFSMHMHDVKVETFWVRSGSGKLRYVDPETGEQDQMIIMENDLVDISRLTLHQIEAGPTSKLVLVEFSTHHKDEDSYRAWREVR